MSLDRDWGAEGHDPLGLGVNDEATLVRQNLMSEPFYAPYCGEDRCMGRAPFNGSQFKCSRCGWLSQFAADFIDRYKAKWGKP